jgi:hypothetical protein
MTHIYSSAVDNVDQRGNAMKRKTKPVPQEPELKRMNLNVERRLHDQFKAATAAEGKDMTTILTDFIQTYVAEHLPESLRRRGNRQ